MKKLLTIFLFSFFLFLVQEAKAYNYADSYITLNGSSSYGDIGNVLSVDRTDSFSFNTYIKTSSACGGYCNIFSKQQNGGSYRGYSLFITNNGKLNFQLLSQGGGANGIEIIGNTTVNDGVWHKITLQYDGCSNVSCVRLWIDEAVETYSTQQNNLTDTIANTESWKIGTRGSSYWFNGQIGETQIMATISGSFYSSRWTFADVSGGIAPDNNGSFDMTLYNCTATVNSLITATNPTQGQLLLPGSIIFSGSYQNPSETYDKLLYWVFDNINTSYQLGMVDISGTSGSFSDTKNLPAGNYSWYAYLLNSDTELQSPQMPEIDFTVGSSTIPNANIPATFNCSQYSDVGDFFCNVLVGLFYPSQNAITQFSNVQNELMTKSPFGYFTLARQKFLTIDVEEESAPILSANVNFGQGNTELKIFDMAETADVVGTSGMTLIYNLIKYAVWLGFLGFCYHEVKRIFNGGATV